MQSETTTCRKSRHHSLSLKCTVDGLHPAPFKNHEKLLFVGIYTPNNRRRGTDMAMQKQVNDSSPDRIRPRYPADARLYPFFRIQDGFAMKQPRTLKGPLMS